MKTLILCLLMLATFGLANTSAAQSDFWTMTIGRQLADGIQSEAPRVRARAIQATHNYARFGPTVDLSATVPALVDVYRSDPDPRYRVAAVAALHAIGNEEGMLSVRSNLMRQTNELVQATSILMLRDYFGPGTFEDSPEVADLAKELIQKRTSRMTIAAR